MDQGFQLCAGAWDEPGEQRARVADVVHVGELADVARRVVARLGEGLAQHREAVGAERREGEQAVLFQHPADLGRDGGRIVTGFGSGGDYPFADFFDDVGEVGLVTELRLSQIVQGT